MRENTDKNLKSKSLYSAAITREQFLYNEMKITAQLLEHGLNEEGVISRIVSDNLYKYPSDKSLRKMVLVCLRRLNALGDEALIKAQ